MIKLQNIILIEEVYYGKKLLEIMKDKIRFKHYSLSTERTYLHWTKDTFYITIKNRKNRD